MVMKTSFHLISIALLFVGMAANANMFPESINYALDARRATIVAEVRIVAGKEVLGPQGQNCNHSYEAEVLDSIKGASKGQKIKFWAFQGKTIGSSYIILLTTVGSQYDKSFDQSIDLEKARGKTPSKEVCAPLVPKLRMMHVLGAYIGGMEAVGEGRYVTLSPYLGGESPGLEELGQPLETDKVSNRGAFKVPLFKFKEYLNSYAAPR
jgi:hypothetical protein